MELLWPLTQPGPLPPLPGSRPIAKEAIARFGFYRRIGVRICHADMRPPFHRQFLRPSLVALLIVLTFMMLALPAQLMSAWAWVPTVGLKVRLMRPGIDGVPSPGIQPVLVHVRFDGTRRSVTVNNEPVPWNQLGVTLRRELRLRPPDWPVYVDGDRNMEWGHTVAAIDVLQGLHRQVVLLTH
jgi:biopolymer transport protein ExbD